MNTNNFDTNTDNDEWKCLKPILQELDSLFEKDDDCRAALEVKEMESQLLRISQLKMKDGKELLKCKLHAEIV
jgi:hypothetical protein